MNITPVLHGSFVGTELMEPPVAVSEEVKTVISRWIKVSNHYGLPVSRQQHRIENRFRSLMDEWRKSVNYSSSVTEMATHPTYQQIIGMGPSAIPLLLRELGKNPDHWFWALRAITGIDPVKPEQRGRIKEMAQAWLQWGKEQGYI